MMRSLYSGVAGLKTHQTRMDVIGNNIANVNTTAFKSSTINFSDLMSQTTQNASGPNAATGTGGTNARQIGLGVKTGAITVNMDGQGSAQSTGNPFDIMITGDNFFVVSNGQSNFFTRDGSFYVDGGGNLAMTSTGYNVMGWQVDPDTMEIKQDSVSALRIMSDANMTYPPEATNKATVAGILDQNDTDVTSDSGKNINLNFFDALGYPYTARLTVKDSDVPGSYSVELTKLLDANGNAVDMSEADNPMFEASSVKDTVTITLKDGYAWSGSNLVNNNVTPPANAATLPITRDATTGEYTEESLNAIAAIAEAYGYQGSVEDFLKLASDADNDANATLETSMESLINSGGLPTYANDNYNTDAAGTKMTFDGRNMDGITINFNTATGAFTGISGSTATTAVLKLSQLGINPDTGMSNFDDITIDFSEISMFNNNGTSTVAATSGDAKGLGAGRMLGNMIGVSVQNNGMIYASYDNGQTKLLGQIATAAFANNSGLSKEGDNLYSSTMNSGEFDGIGVDVTANGGYMTTGVLEMSNVDLSNEFTTMITTQRGFQANSRIITVSDTLLEELTNLKR
ncbi:MAG: flagellar hook-basal body complex protein [Lachnospiraceae bacterium]|nr:flagellar hook-basal body complex protein [Lachnospiraceae bacterium]